MAITDADPALVVKFKSMGKWPLPCQMVSVLKPLTQTQQSEKKWTQRVPMSTRVGRLVTCGNFAALSEQSTATTNLDAPLLRLMLSLAWAEDTTWSSVDITNAFLNADIHDVDTVLVTLPPILVKMNITQPNTGWQVKKACYLWISRSTRLWQGEWDRQLRDLELQYLDHKAPLVQSHIHPNLWFTVKGPVVQSRRIPQFDHFLKSDKWTAKLHDHAILGYLGVHVDDLLTADKRTLKDALIDAIQQVWKISTPEHLGPDPDCVPVLRCVNLERVNNDKGQELDLPAGTILVNELEDVLEVLMKLEPTSQLRSRTIQGNQERKLCHTRKPIIEVTYARREDCSPPLIASGGHCRV